MLARSGNMTWTQTYSRGVMCGARFIILLLPRWWPSVLQIGDHVPFYSTANGSRKRVPEMCAPSEPVLVASGANSLRLGAEQSL